jgi:hypothetical protein
MYRYFFFVAGASFEHNIKKQTNIEFSQCQWLSWIHETFFVSLLHS